VRILTSVRFIIPVPATARSKA